MIRKAFYCTFALLACSHDAEAGRLVTLHAYFLFDLFYTLDQKRELRTLFLKVIGTNQLWNQTLVFSKPKVDILIIRPASDHWVGM